MFTGSMGKIAVFCGYAREDEPIRAELESRLVYCSTELSRAGFGTIRT
jgi:hypothetical protein